MNEVGGMMAEATIETWVKGYIKAWASNAPEEIGGLFTEEAEYFTAPYRKPWKGRAAIVQEWIDRRDTPNTYEFRYEVLVEARSPVIVRGWTRYHNPERNYSNLWVIRLDPSGKCKEFVEWWMEEPRAGEAE